jgi:peptidoglycan LD-endopeptidase LytH
LLEEPVMNRLQALFLVLLLGFVAVMWLGTGRVPPPSLIQPVPLIVESAPSVVQPETQITQLEKPLIIPVAGVRPDQLLDTFTDSRSEGRTHDAIDIMAPAETPVLAAADGQIQKLWLSERGGTSIYQLSADQKMIFYYAHLARYADGLTEGKQVRQGETIAYVGDTGNAGTGNYHLHFSIAIVSDPNRYWEGTNVNPYPLLHK